VVQGTFFFYLSGIISSGFYLFSGIGLGIARAFAKAKYNIILNGLEKNGSDITASTAKEFQVNHLFSPANALHNDQLRAMVDDGLSKFKHIGLLLLISS